MKKQVQVYYGQIDENKLDVSLRGNTVSGFSNGTCLYYKPDDR